jgi:hypothetical protein
MGDHEPGVLELFCSNIDLINGSDASLEISGDGEGQQSYYTHNFIN